MDGVGQKGIICVYDEYPISVIQCWGNEKDLASMISSKGILLIQLPYLTNNAQSTPVS